MPEPARSVPGEPPSSPGDGSRHFGLTDMMLVGMALIWGVNFSVVKFGTEVVAPLAFNGARTLIASIALTAVVAFMRPARLSRRDLVLLLALGVLGNGIYQYLFVEGIARTRAGNAALMLSATPAFVAIIGRIRGVERIGQRALVGIVLSMAGIGLIVFSTASANTGESTVTGDLLVLVSCLTWALYTVLLKPYTHRIDGVQLSAVTMIGGTVALLLAAAPDMLAAPWGAMPASGWGAILFSGLGALVMGYLFWYRGIRVLGPTRTAMYSNLQPVIALLVAWVALAETPTVHQAIGALLILGGLFLTRASR